MGKWNRKANEMKIQESGDKINDFVRKNWLIRKARKNWWKLSDNLAMKNGLYGALQIFDRIRLNKGFNLLFNTLGNRIKKDGFNTLKDNTFDRHSTRLIRNIFANFQNR